MSPRPPRGRTGPAGRRGAATTFTPTTLAPGPAAPPGKRPQGLTRWLCLLPAVWARGEAPGQKANTGGGQHHGAGEVGGATRPRRGPPPPSRRRAQAYLQKLLAQEMQRRNLRRARRGAVGVQAAPSGAAREGDQEAGPRRWPRLPPCCPLACCCLLAFLLMMAVFAETFRTLEDARQHPTHTQLRQEAVAAAALVVTAAWCLSALPTPAATTASEVLLLVLLTLTNACLVLLTRTVLAAQEPLRYRCCGWLLGVLAPFCLMVVVAHYIPGT